MLAVPSSDPARAVPNRLRQRSPAARATIQRVSPIRAAVERLGCLRISSSSPPKLPSQRSFWSRLIRLQGANRLAACSTTKGFTSSEGCICSGPSTSQRLAPFTVVPITRVAAISRQPIHNPGPDQRSHRRRLVEIVMPSKLQLAKSQIACRFR